MTKLADYSQAVTADQLDAALRAGGFDGVFHYIRGTAGWVIRIEDPGVVAGIRAKGWPQLGIDLPLNPSDADGAAMAAAARAYGYPAGSLMALDVEPSRFVLDPAGWARAADAWCDGVRAGGYVPGPYGTDDTVAACGSRADWIWRAKPGQCDPAGPGLADAFFAGRRVVQCSSGVWGGVEFDVSYSQFAGISPRGGLPMSGTAGFYIAATNTTHTFDLLADGHIGWSRSGGGAGQELHQGVFDLGGPADCREFAAWIEPPAQSDPQGTLNRIVLRAKLGDGSGQEMVLSAETVDPSAATILGWTQMDAGPPGTFRVDVYQGEAGPGPDDDSALAARIATLETDLADIKAAIR